MTHVRFREHLILCVAPNSEGFGFVTIETRGTVIDWGVRRVDRSSSDGIRQAIEKVYRRHRAGTLLCRIPRSRRGATRYNEQVAATLDALAKLNEGIHSTITAEEVAELFEVHAGARKKDEVAMVIGTILPTLKHLIPEPRRSWTSERWNMCVFDAAAACTVYLYGEAAVDRFKAAIAD